MRKESQRAIALLAGSMLAAGLLASSFVFAADSAGEGWGGFRFGMTIADARAVTGYTWAEPEHANVQTMPGTTAVWTVLRSEAKVTFGGQAFDLEIDFDDKDSLKQIKLRAEQATNAFAACDAAFGKLLVKGEGQFGSFRPVEVAHAEKHEVDTEKETGTSDWMTTIEHRNAPDGKSTYEHMIIKWRRTHDAPWHVHHIDNAIRSLSSSYVELMGTLSPKEPCALFVGFAAGPYPTKK